MIHLFRTKRSGFSSKISILSKKILIRLNVKVQNTRKCWTKIWFTHFCFSPKLKPARIKNSYLVFKRKSLELKWRWTTYVNACCRQFTSKPINFQIFSHFHVLELSLKLRFIPAFPKCFEKAEDFCLDHKILAAPICWEKSELKTEIKAWSFL